jgi:hypothetical protein
MFWVFFAFKMNIKHQVQFSQKEHKLAHFTHVILSWFFKWKNFRNTVPTVKLDAQMIIHCQN